MIFRAFLFCLLLAPSLALAITCDCYLRSSDGSDVDDCSTWALAKATLAGATGALSATSPGDTICMDDDHSESSSTSISITGGGAVGNPIKIIVVQTDTTTPVTTYSASPNYQTTGSGDFIRFDGWYYFYGIHLYVGDGLQIAGNGSHGIFEKSKLVDFITDTGSTFGPYTGDAAKLEMIDTVVKAASFNVKLGGSIVWRGGSYESTGGEFNYLFRLNTEGGRGSVEGVDLSAWAGSTALIETATAMPDQFNNWDVHNCKLPGTVTLFSGSPISPNTAEQVFKVDASDDADGYWKLNRKFYAGTAEYSSSIYRTGGSEYASGSGYSLEMTTNSSAKENVSCIRQRITGYGAVDATTSADVAVHLTYDDATVWNNDDFSIEVKYHDATDEALGQWARTKPTTAADAGDRTAFTDVSSTETWTGTSGFTNPQEETHEVNFTGANGPIEIWGVLCKPSSTAYIDLLPDITEN